MRWWARLVVLAAALVVLLASLSMWHRCSDGRPPSASPPPWLSRAERPSGLLARTSPVSQLNDPAEADKLTDIRCSINDEYSVGCKAAEKEVYLPFSFIKKYFEVYGDMTEERGKRVFKWSHSYGKVFAPTEPYRADGEFMYFGSYNVERRDRVKGISGIHGVPVTTQWLPSGFYYPIQIAQFGLSHFSRNLTDSSPRRLVVLPGGRVTTGRIRTVHDSELGEDVVQFAPPYKLTVKVDSVGKPILIMDLKLADNATVAVDLVFRDSASTSVRVHYVCSDVLISSQGTDVYVGLGASWSGYKHVIRDLSVDALKGVVGRGRGGGQKLTPQRMRVQAVHVWGGGRLRRVTLASSDHLGQFVQAADWLLRQQAASGAWTIPVQRRLNERMVLKPHWCSAMGQGQAMSLLTRAYRVTGDRRYLDAARRATAPFSVDSEHGGVRTYFQEKYVWYEEYPTVPGSLVLNGFIYSLMGLYDLNHTAGGDPEAARLYAAGLASLRALLPLFDTGSGTLYDLRHVTSGVAPNVARWDYHVTHVNQLLVLATIESEPLFGELADRWTEYMRGRRAPHN